MSMRGISIYVNVCGMKNIMVYDNKKMSGGDSVMCIQCLRFSKFWTSNKSYG